jgi:hypothetical protein
VAEEKLRWLLEPPKAGNAHVYVAVGENTKLTPAVEDALEKLMAALHESDDDVSGFLCSDFSGQHCDCEEDERGSRLSLSANFTRINTTLNSRSLGCNISGMMSGM